jgi:hypothetical protein
MARPPDERYLLDRIADFNTKPSVASVSHVGADDAARDLSPIGVIPQDAS